MKTTQLVATPRLLLLLCSLLLCLDSFAQSLKITGTVTGADGQKIPGASVSLASARGSGTVSDATGNFSLTVPASPLPSSFPSSGTTTPPFPSSPAKPTSTCNWPKAPKPSTKWW